MNRADQSSDDSGRSRLRRLSRLGATAGLLGVSALAAAAWYGQPEGARLVQTKCTGCHWSSPIGDVKYDRIGWELTVDRMETHGMQISEEERESIIEWLATERSTR